MGADAARVNVIYPGRSDSIAPLTGRDAADKVTVRFGLQAGYMLSVGNIEPRKNLDCVLSALDLLPDAGVLAVVGGVGWRCGSTLRRLMEYERLGRVRYLGRVSDAELAALYGAAGVMVYPSLYEGFGSPVVEAMACGCPVVCSRSSSLPEVGGAAALYFDARSPGDLARCISGILASSSLRTHMATEGVARAARFSYRLAASRLGSLIEALV
jgi:alpha-1,3-rhamnosyl/mannosyltransferase